MFLFQTEVEHQHKRTGAATYVIVALDGVDKSLIGHDLRFSAEEGLEAFFDCLQLLFADLRDTNM